MGFKGNEDCYTASSRAVSDLKGETFKVGFTRAGEGQAHHAEEDELSEVDNCSAAFLALEPGAIGLISLDFLKACKNVIFREVVLKRVATFVFEVKQRH